MLCFTLLWHNVSCICSKHELYSSLSHIRNRPLQQVMSARYKMHLFMCCILKLLSFVVLEKWHYTSVTSVILATYLLFHTHTHTRPTTPVPGYSYCEGHCDMHGLPPSQPLPSALPANTQQHTTTTVTCMLLTASWNWSAHIMNEHITWFSSTALTFLLHKIEMKLIIYRNV